MVLLSDTSLTNVSHYSTPVAPLCPVPGHEGHTADHAAEIRKELETFF